MNTLFSGLAIVIACLSSIGNAEPIVARLAQPFGAGCSVNSDCQSGACSTFYKICAESGCSGTCSWNPNAFCWSAFCYQKQPINGRCRVNSDCSSDKCYFGYCSNTSPPTCNYCVNCPSSCPVGSYCGDVQKTGVDIGSGYCYSTLPTGTPCEYNNQCDTKYCDSTNRCAMPSTPALCPLCVNGYYCDKLTHYQCVPKKAFGSYCSSGYECQSGYCNSQQQCGQQAPTICPFCVPGYYCDQTTGFQCLPKKANWLPCSSSYECISGNCNSNKQCSPQHLSICPLCIIGYYCDKSTNYQCVSKKSDGSYCSSAYECTSGFCNSLQQCGPQAPIICPLCVIGYYCDQTTGHQCFPKKANGLRCSSAYECVSDYCNASQTCAPQLGPTCPGASSPCAPGQYCQSGVAGWTCTPLPLTSNTPLS